MNHPLLPPHDARLLAWCQRLVRLAAHLAPAECRADWQAEWSAELLYRIDRLAGSLPTARAPRRVIVARAMGAFPHALWLRLQHWRLNVQDVRFGIRSLARQPIFALAVIGTLALGVAANTAMFTLIDAVLLRPLPYPEPDQLVWAFGSFAGNSSASVSPPDFVDYRQRNHVFASMGAMVWGGQQSVSLAAGGEPQRVVAATITDDLLPTLGVRPVVGRGFHREEARAGAPLTALISHRLWCDRFDCNPDVVGRNVDVDARPTTIIGVLPAGFELPFDARIGRTADVQVWMPLRIGDPEYSVRRFHFLAVVARLKPGLPVAAAQADVDVIARQLAAAFPENATWGLRLLPLRDEVVANVRASLLILQLVVALVLLVACGNVTSLMLARASTRSAEMAVRSALGASRGRLLRLLLTETALLALAGAAAGLPLAWWGLTFVRAYAPPSIPRVNEIRVDATVLLFTLGIALAVTLVCGLSPALLALRKDLASAVKAAGRSSNGRSPRRLRDALVVGQVAASVVLLTAAGLLVRSLWHLQAVPSGFDNTTVTTTQVWLPEERYPTDSSRRLFFETLLDRLAAVPGVEGAALIDRLPMTGANDTLVFAPEQPPATPADRQFPQIRIVSPGYFETMGMSLVAGRDLSAHDGPQAPPVVVINQAMAREYFGDNPAIGRRLVIDLREPMTATVVGVVRDVREFGPAEQPPGVFYMPAAALPLAAAAIVVRSPLDAQAVVPAVRDAVRSMDPGLPLGRIESMDAIVGKSIAQPRFRSLFLGGFAALALVLTAVGLHGSLGYLVALRSREIGIRLALGAATRQVMRSVVGHGATLVAAGLAIGILLALIASRLLAGLLFMVSPHDPAVFGTALASVAVCGLTAAVIPARRAARVDPVSALRTD